MFSFLLQGNKKRQPSCHCLDAPGRESGGPASPRGPRNGGSGEVGEASRTPGRQAWPDTGSRGPGHIWPLGTEVSSSVQGIMMLWVEWRRLAPHPLPSGSQVCLCPPPSSQAWDSSAQSGRTSWGTQQRQAGFRLRPASPARPVAPICGQPTSPGGAQPNEQVWLLLSRKRPGLAPQ